MDDTSQNPQAFSPSGDRYVVVARRYRPGSFDELIGQEHVARALCSAIETNRVGHAYLFTGARGVGKTSAARILAKALNCEQGPTATPCNECDTCRRIAAGSDVDVLEIDGASNRGIDEIRQLRQNAGVRPSRSRFKIYIIDEVHMLTKEAFNALLKTLEEPPEHVKFIFATTEPNKIPITILSRCQRFDFAGIQTKKIEARLAEIARLEQVDVEPAALELLAHRAAGSMRDSQSLLEQLLSLGSDKITAADVHALLGTAPVTRLAAVAERMIEGDSRAALEALSAAISEGTEVGQLVDQLLGYFRDLMAAAVGCSQEQFLHVTEDAAAQVTELSKQLSVERVLAILQVLEQAAAQLRWTVNDRIVAEMAVVRIAHLDRLDQVASLIAALQEGTLEVPSGGGSKSAPRAAGGDASKKNALGKHHRGETAAQPSDESSLAASVAAASASQAAMQRQATVFSGSPEAARPASARPDAAQTSAFEEQEKLQEQASRKQAEPPAREDSSGPTAGSLDEATAQALWDATLRELPGLLADQAGYCDSIAISAPNLLVARFNSTYNSCKEFCEQPAQKSKLEQTLSEKAGFSLRLEFRQIAGATDRRRAKKPKSQLLRQRKGEVISQPLVQRAMQLFGDDEPRVDLPEE